MASDIRVIRVREFLKATVHGTPDLQGSKEALLEIAQTTPPPGGFDLLIDVRESPTHLTLSELTELALEFRKLHLGRGRKTAVLTEANRFENARFFAITSRNMGGNVQPFASFEEAFDWLTGPPEAEDQP